MPHAGHHPYSYPTSNSVAQAHFEFCLDRIKTGFSELRRAENVNPVYANLQPSCGTLHPSCQTRHSAIGLLRYIMRPEPATRHPIRLLPMAEANYWHSLTLVPY
jgi:hypothetical protein